MSKRIVKTAREVTVNLGGPLYAGGAYLSLIGGKRDGKYLRAEIPAPSSAPSSVTAWCDGRTMRAFIAEAARRLGLMDKAKGKRK